jgi:hypothetical protein
MDGIMQYGADQFLNFIAETGRSLRADSGVSIMGDAKYLPAG